MRPIITSKKHFVQLSPTTTAGTTTFTLELAEAVQNLGAGTTPDLIAVGATVKAVWLEFWVVSNTNALGSGSIILEKLPSAVTPITFAQSQALFTYPNKNNILYVTQGLTGADDVTSPTPFVRGWFKIPKGKQRMALGDKLVLNFTGIVGIQFCGMAIYKEYT